MKLIQLLLLYDTILHTPGPRGSPHRVDLGSRLVVSGSVTGSLNSESRDPVPDLETLPCLKSRRTGIEQDIQLKIYNARSPTASSMVNQFLKTNLII